MITNVAGDEPDVATTCLGDDVSSLIEVVVLNLLSRIESNSRNCSMVLEDMRLFGVDTVVEVVVVEAVEQLWSPATA